MPIPSGLDASIGFKSESTWGTAVVVDQFAPFISESIDQQIERLESQAIRKGRRAKHTWRPGGITVSGGVELELANQPMATLLRHMFGTIGTTGAGPYVHTASPGDLTGKSMTMQVGVPDETGTVRVKTYNGVKIADWDIACSANEIARLTLNVSAREEVTSTALATVSYATPIRPFVFTEAALSLGGSAVATVRSMNLSGQNSLAVDRHRIGSALVRQQLEAGQRDYTGTISADFESLVAYDRFVNGTEAALVMTFTSGTDVLQITSNVRFDGETPKVAGMDMIEQSLPFVATSGTTDAAAITAVLTNGEAVST